MSLDLPTMYTNLDIRQGEKVCIDKVDIRESLWPCTGRQTVRYLSFPHTVTEDCSLFTRDFRY
jgi:hypothetical protein